MKGKLTLNSQWMQDKDTSLRNGQKNKDKAASKGKEIQWLELSNGTIEKCDGFPLLYKKL